MLAAGMLLAGLLLSCGDDDSVGPGKPAKIIAINGLYYKGEMGSDTVDKPLQFAVADKNDNYLPYQQIQLEQLEGDGKLDPKSIVTDSTGIASFTFNFNGTSGHTRIRLIAPDIDSFDILIRANTLIPGPSGQGQYVLFDDTYADVKHFNGQPASVDIIDTSEVIYVNYETELGVVVMVYDLDTNGVIYDTSSVYGVIVNTVYSETTAEGIRIGSPIDSLRSAYGEPSSIYWDSRPPASVAIVYNTLGLTFYCWPSDTSVFEIHLTEVVSDEQGSRNRKISAAPLRYH